MKTLYTFLPDMPLPCFFFSNHMKYVNKKNKKEYTVITLNGIDCTNERDGLQVVIYTDGTLYFTREYSEFLAKFDPIKIQEKA